MMQEVSITVRDGVEIGAAVYAPEGNGRFPALLAASPYRYDNDMLPAGPQFLGRETGPIEFYIKHGYVYVHMDVRGCGKSGGEFEFLGPNEQRDLCDVIEWIAGQPWSNGKVGATSTAGGGPRGRGSCRCGGHRTPGRRTRNSTASSSTSAC